jgi:hypothetical protein
MECTLCNYTAKTKGNYQKHCNTAKHIIKEQKLKGYGNTRTKPQEIIDHLHEGLLDVKRIHKAEIEELTESYEEQLREKERTIQSKINIEIANNKFKKTLKELEYIDHYDNILITDVYNENKKLKAKIDQMEKQLIKTIDISGNYVIGRKLI